MERRVLVTRAVGSAAGPGGQRPPAINRHAAPKRMLVHSRPLNPGRDDSQRMPACCLCRTRGRHSRVHVVFPRLNELLQ